MIEMQTLNLVVFYTALLIMSIVDLKTQEISLKVLIPFGLYGIVQLVVSGDKDISLFYALLPGLLIMAVSILSSGQIGFGDGLLICVCGLYMSLVQVLIWLFAAFLICGIFGVLMLWFKRIGKKTSIPFVPFLFASAILGGVICR